MVTQYTTLLDALPLWGLFCAIVLLVLAAIEGGYRLGTDRLRRSHAEKDAPVGAMVGATVGLLAFMLAFTFGMAASRFDTRKQLVLDEANAIGTTYLRAAMLPEQRDEIRPLLRAYVDARLEAFQSGRVEEHILQSEDIQTRLWSAATAAALQHPDSIVVGLFVQSLNEVIDLHAKRVTAGLRNRIPGAIWFALLTMAMLSMAALGYHAGLVGTTRSLAIIVVAVAFSAVIALIADLDRPQEGALTVSQQALIDVRNSMNPPGK
jgi:drug/metabolite transporter (DMT)-like permease